MAAEYKIFLGQITDGKVAPITTGSYSLRWSADSFASEKYTATVGSNGVINFGTIQDGTYRLYVTGGSQVANYGEKYIADSEPEFDNVYTGGKVFTDDIAEYTTAAGVTIDGVLLKDSIVSTDTISEKTSAAGVTIDGTLIKDNIVTCAGVVNSGTLVNTGLATFNGRISAIGGTTGNTFYGKNTFMAEVPFCAYVPTQGNHLTNQTYVNSQISNAITSILAGNYVESGNIIRLIPDAASDVAGQLYNTWKKCYDYIVTQSPTVNKQYTILIAGNGTSASYIAPVSSSSKYIADYIHVKGLGNNVQLKFPSIADNEFEGTDFSRIIIEGITFVFDDSSTNLTSEFYGVKFKNCLFIITSQDTVTFTDCKFEGTNEFYSTTDNVFQFVNCIGSPIFISNEKTIARSGTNLIDYTTPKSLAINEAIFTYATDVVTLNKWFEITGGLKLTTFTSLPGSSGAIVIGDQTAGFGDKTNNKIMLEPHKWINVTVGSTEYALPLYNK